MKLRKRITVPQLVELPGKEDLNGSFSVFPIFGFLNFLIKRMSEQSQYKVEVREIAWCFFVWIRCGTSIPPKKKVNIWQRFWYFLLAKIGHVSTRFPRTVEYTSRNSPYTYTSALGKNERLPLQRGPLCVSRLSRSPSCLFLAMPKSFSRASVPPPSFPKTLRRRKAAFAKPHAKQRIRFQVSYLSATRWAENSCGRSSRFFTGHPRITSLQRFRACGESRCGLWRTSATTCVWTTQTSLRRKRGRVHKLAWPGLIAPMGWVSKVVKFSH